MKKYLLALSIATLAFTANTVKAQFIINSAADDFETWSADILVSSAMDPNSGAGSPGWQCFNMLNSPFVGSSPLSVFQESTIIHSGKYSCKIMTVALSSTSYGYVKTFIPTDTTGIVVSGTVITSPAPEFKLGVPINNCPASLSFWYNYMPQTAKTTGKADTAFCTVTLSRHIGGKHNILGGGILKLNGTTGWAQGTVPIFYDSTGVNADSITVLFSSSSFTHPALGSLLYVDGATIVAGINEITPVVANVNVYPNPASTEINFNITSTGEVHNAAIYDITGKKISGFEVKNNFATINTGSFAPGLYFYQLYDKAGNALKMGKFSVVR